MSVLSSVHPMLSVSPTGSSEPTSLTLHRGLFYALGLCLLGAGAFSLDLPISRWMHTHQGLKALHQPLQVAEAIGDGWGVAVILISIYVVSLERRPALLRILLTTLTCACFSNSIKLFVARLRPRSYPGDGLLHVESVSDTFYGWLPWLGDPTTFGSRYQSFPSGHTATGFALAVALTRLFPRGGWWFTTIALAIALQRMETGAHYFSDTCFGAAIGVLTAMSFQSGTPWSRWLDRWEARRTEYLVTGANSSLRETGGTGQ